MTALKRPRRYRKPESEISGTHKLNVSFDMGPYIQPVVKMATGCKVARVIEFTGTENNCQVSASTN